MQIIFVIGPPASGKSYFIKENFPEAKVVDLYDFQENLSVVDTYTVWNSYEDTRDALINAIKNAEDNDTIVLEHTLLMKKRRPMYIEAVRSVTDAPIICYAMSPSAEKIKEYCEKRQCFLPDILTAMEIYELPEVDEGFAEVHIVS